MKKELAKEIIQKIEKEKIKQTPKYFFTLKNILVWIFLSVSIFLGAISISISSHYIFSAEWDLSRRIGILKIISTFLPIFWLIFLLISIFFAYINLKNTNKGYKLSLIKILGINIFLSLILGIIIIFSGLNKTLESQIQNIIPKYRSYFVEDKITRMISIWQNEDSGLIIGTIMSSNEKSIKFKDYNNKIWNIIINNETNIKGKIQLKEGTKIKIIGEKINEKEFSAIEIRPFMGKNNY